MSQFFALGGPKYWSFSFQWIFRTIFIRIDWFDLFAVQGTLKSLLQHRSSKASVLQHSAFFIVQLSHAYMTTGKTIALPRQIFAGRVMSLLFNVLSRLVIAFLPRSKCLDQHGSQDSCSQCPWPSGCCWPVPPPATPDTHRRRRAHVLLLHHLVPNWSHGSQSCLTQWNYGPCSTVPPKTDGSWWRVLTKRGSLENGVASHWNILALRTPWTAWRVWKEKKRG